MQQHNKLLLKQGFNSIKVRLKVVVYSYDRTDVKKVSIP